MTLARVVWDFAGEFEHGAIMPVQPVGKCRITGAAPGNDIVSVLSSSRDHVLITKHIGLFSAVMPD